MHTDQCKMWYFQSHGRPCVVIKVYCSLPNLIALSGLHISRSSTQGVDKIASDHLILLLTNRSASQIWLFGLHMNAHNNIRQLNYNAHWSRLMVILPVLFYYLGVMSVNEQTGCKPSALAGNPQKGKPYKWEDECPHKSLKVTKTHSTWSTVYMFYLFHTD